VIGPDQAEILVFRVEKPKLIPGLAHVLGLYPVSIKNLSGRPCAVSYQVYAYDSQNLRLDEMSDSVAIGARETVLEQLNFSHPLPAEAQTLATFRVIADIEH
jgi:uncharacterized protein YcfL